MNLEGDYPRLDAVTEILGSEKKWDYVVIDAWHLGREPVENDPARASVPPRFPQAVSAFVKEVRAHSPGCKIILFPWWIPRGPKVTNEGAMEVFRRCAEQAKANELWVATTGPAFMEARLERPDLKITVSKTDAHPGKEARYINVCSLYAIITDKSPVGLPAALEITSTDGKKKSFALARRREVSARTCLEGLRARAQERKTGKVRITTNIRARRRRARSIDLSGHPRRTTEVSDIRIPPHCDRKPEAA